MKVGDIKSYTVKHLANLGKQDKLFQLYEVYTQEYLKFVHSYWNQFIRNKVNNNKFSHLGSTKQLQISLN